MPAVDNTTDNQASSFNRNKNQVRGKHSLWFCYLIANSTKRKDAYYYDFVVLFTFIDEFTLDFHFLHFALLFLEDSKKIKNKVVSAGPLMKATECDEHHLSRDFERWKTYVNKSLIIETWTRTETLNMEKVVIIIKLLILITMCSAVTCRFIHKIEDYNRPMPQLVAECRRGCLMKVCVNVFKTVTTIWRKLGSINYSFFSRRIVS